MSRCPSFPSPASAFGIQYCVAISSPGPYQLTTSAPPFEPPVAIAFLSDGTGMLPSLLIYSFDTGLAYCKWIFQRPVAATITPHYVTDACGWFLRPRHS